MYTRFQQELNVKCNLIAESQPCGTDRPLFGRKDYFRCLVGPRLRLHVLPNAVDLARFQSVNSRSEFGDSSYRTMALLTFRLLNRFQHYYSYRSGASASLLKSLFYSMEIF